MPELREGLERLAQLTAPPRDALDRLARKRNRMQRNRRVGAALLAFAVAGAGVGVTLVTFGRSGIKPLPALRIKNGYGIQFPDTPLGYQKNGIAVFDAATNLPSGTKVSVYLFSADIESPGQAVVMDGRIPIRISNGFCHETEVGLEGTTTMVTIVVSPVSGSIPTGGSAIRGGSPYTPPPYQPPNVQAALGPNFERLTGDQVREDNGRKLLVASKLVRLPADTCQKKLVYTGGGDFRQVPVDQPVKLPTGPFPQPPFRSCPNPRGSLPVEAGDVETADEVAVRFDKALTDHDHATLEKLADLSVLSFRDWNSTGVPSPFAGNNIPSGNYLPAVPSGCGALVALRTWGVTITKSGNELDPLKTYLLILRPGGWKVWGELPGDGR